MGGGTYRGYGFGAATGSPGGTEALPNRLLEPGSPGPACGAIGLVLRNWWNVCAFIGSPPLALEKVSWHVARVNGYLTRSLTVRLLSHDKANVMSWKETVKAPPKLQARTGHSVATLHLLPAEPRLT